MGRGRQNTHTTRRRGVCVCGLPAPSGGRQPRDSCAPAPLPPLPGAPPGTVPREGPGGPGGPRPRRGRQAQVPLAALRQTESRRPHRVQLPLLRAEARDGGLGAWGGLPAAWGLWGLPPRAHAPDPSRSEAERAAQPGRGARKTGSPPTPGGQAPHAGVPLGWGGTGWPPPASKHTGPQLRLARRLGQGLWPPRDGPGQQAEGRWSCRLCLLRPALAWKGDCLPLVTHGANDDSSGSPSWSLHPPGRAAAHAPGQDACGAPRPAPRCVCGFTLPTLWSWPLLLHRQSYFSH